MTVTYTNAETHGRLKLYKTGEVLTGYEEGAFVYEDRFLKGCVFEVTAAEDIATQDNQGTNWYDKGELVTTITTGRGAEFTRECKDITGFTVDKDGMVTVDLPLGKYHVTEKEAGYGYVLPEQGWDVEFNWKNKDEEYVLNATDATDKDGVLNVANARAKTVISLFKTDAATRQAVEGAVFGIFTRNDIYNADGKKIVAGGTQLGTVTTDADGNAKFNLDLPLMSEDYPKVDTDSAVDAEPTETPAVGTMPPLESLLTPANTSKTAFGKDTEDVEDESGEDMETEEDAEDESEDEHESVPATDSATTLNSGDYYLKELSVSGSYYLNQTEYPVHLEYKDQETKIIAADVEAENTQTNTVISKTSVTNSEELPGCELQITDATGSAIVSWISGDKDSIKLNEKLKEMGYRNVTAVLDEKGAVQINGLLHDTTYTLTETRPADGFATADSISFQLVEGENSRTLAAIVEDDMILQPDHVVRMVDDTTKVEISKTEITGEEEIPGCELEITDKESGKVIDFWTSTEEKHLVEQKFIVGRTYVLTEKRPADGYARADSVEFIVEDTGEIQTVAMKDDTTKIRLIKLAGDTGEGLRGAKFEVYDSEGKKVLAFTSKEVGYDITGKLAVGETYTFKEVEAPKGYKLAKAVKYTIKDTGELQKVSVTDERQPKPRVPQTGGNTPLMAAVFLFVLAGGAWLVFRKKRLRA